MIVEGLAGLVDSTSYGLSLSSVLDVNVKRHVVSKNFGERYILGHHFQR